MRARGGGRARGEGQVVSARDREDKDETGRSRRGGAEQEIEEYRLPNEAGCRGLWR